MRFIQVMVATVLLSVPAAATADETQRSIGVAAVIAGPILSIGMGAGFTAAVATEVQPSSFAAAIPVFALGAAAQAICIGMTVYGGFMIAGHRRTHGRTVAVTPFASRDSFGAVASWSF